MTEFRGFRCDECSGIIEDSKDRTKQRVRFEGVVDGEYSRDLCPDCAKKVSSKTKDEMTPLRRRRPRGSDSNQSRLSSAS